MPSCRRQLDWHEHAAAHKSNLESVVYNQCIQRRPAFNLTVYIAVALIPCFRYGVFLMGSYTKPISSN